MEINSREHFSVFGHEIVQLGSLLVAQSSDIGGFAAEARHESQSARRRALDTKQDRRDHIAATASGERGVVKQAWKVIVARALRQEAMTARAIR